MATSQTYTFFITVGHHTSSNSNATTNAWGYRGHIAAPYGSISGGGGSNEDRYGTWQVRDLYWDHYDWVADTPDTYAAYLRVAAASGSGTLIHGNKFPDAIMFERDGEHVTWYLAPDDDKAGDGLTTHIYTLEKGPNTSMDVFEYVDDDKPLQAIFVFDDAPDGKVFFIGRDGNDGRRMWKIDGNQTSRVSNVFSVPDGSALAYRHGTGFVTLLAPESDGTHLYTFNDNGVEQSKIRISTRPSTNNDNHIERMFWIEDVLIYATRGGPVYRWDAERGEGHLTRNTDIYFPELIWWHDFYPKTMHFDRASTNNTYDKYIQEMRITDISPSIGPRDDVVDEIISETYDFPDNSKSYYDYVEGACMVDSHLYVALRHRYYQADINRTTADFDIWRRSDEGLWFKLDTMSRTSNTPANLPTQYGDGEAYSFCTDSERPPTTGFHLFMDLGQGDDNTVILTDEIDNLLRIDGEWGRSEASVFGISKPVSMQVIMKNDDGRYDQRRLRPRARVWLDYTHWGKQYPVIRGRMSRVKGAHDQRTGLKRAILFSEGEIALLNKADAELQVDLPNVVRTGEVIDHILDRLGFPSNKRDIRQGDVRIHLGHYYHVLGPHLLHQASKLVRAAERAELGYLHEERGDWFKFEDRFHREKILTDVSDWWLIGSTDDALQPAKITEAEDTWENLYTVVRIHYNNVRLHDEADLFDRTPGTTQIIIAAGETWPFSYDISDGPDDNILIDRVRMVESWADPSLDIKDGSASDATDVTHSYTDESADVFVDFFGVSRTRCYLTIKNNTDADVYIHSLKLRGKGISALDIAGDMPEQASLAILEYHRRVLDLPHIMFAENENNAKSDKTYDEDDGQAQVVSYARMILARYDHPRDYGVLKVNPLEYDNQRAMVALRIGDPMLIQAGIGSIATGGYAYEGGTFSMQGGNAWQNGDGDGTAEMGIKYALRGRHTSVYHRGINAIVDDSNSATWHDLRWSDAGTAKTAEYTTDASERYVVTVRMRLNGGDIKSGDDASVRVLRGSAQIIGWQQEALTRDYHTYGVLVEGDGEKIKVQYRRLETDGAYPRIDDFRVIRIDS